MEANGVKYLSRLLKLPTNKKVNSKCKKVEKEFKFYICRLILIFSGSISSSKTYTVKNNKELTWGWICLILDQPLWNCNCKLRYNGNSRLYVSPFKCQAFVYRIQM